MDLDKFLENMEKEEVKGSSDDNSSSDVIKYLKAEYLKEEGEHKIRILPNLKDANENPFKPNYIHFNYLHPEMKDDQGQPKRWVFGCLGKECPLCAYSKGFPEGSEERKNYKASVNFEWYVYDEDNKPKKLVLSYASHTALFEAVVQLAKTGINPLDPKAGRWFYLTRQNLPDKVKYSASSGDEEAPMPDNILKLMDTLTPLDDLNKKQTVDELKNVVAFKKGNYKPSSSASNVQEDSISDTPDLSLPEDDSSSDDAFDFDDLSIDTDDFDLGDD